MRHLILVSLLMLAFSSAALSDDTDVYTGIVAETHAAFTVDTDFITCRFDPASGNLSLSIRDADRRVVESLLIPPVFTNGKSHTAFTPTDSPDAPFVNVVLSVRVETLGPRAIAVTWACRDAASRSFTIRIPDNSAYYGGGERFHALNQKGYVLPMMSIDRPEDKGTVSYKPVPFFMSSRGYGVWINSFSPGVVDFNVTDRNNVLIRYPEDKLTLVFFAGPAMSEILSAYTALSGRPPVPPAWAFAPWKSRDVHRNRDEVLQDVELTRKHDLPGSVIVIDSPWETGYNNFRLNTSQFQNPRAMFDRIEELGFHTCLWLTPFVNSRNVTDMAGIAPGASSNYQEAVDGGYLVKKPGGEVMTSSWWKGDGGLVDFTDPKAVDWWHSQIARTQEWGPRAFKCDDGEGNFVLDAVFHDGTLASKMKNRYALLYLKAMHEYIQKYLNGDGILFARPGFAGSQMYPFCWSGDNYADFSFTNGLPTAILAGQTAALSGIPLTGHDIAGYQGRPSREVFIRWTQFGAFSPVMQVHMTSNLGPWDFDELTLSVYRKFAKLHTSLYPYRREAAIQARRTGMPIVRPMVLAFQSDPNAAKQIFQYMYGPDLLVAPMFQAGQYRSVYLPQGSWIDYWSGKEFKGGTDVEVHAPLDLMPLFVRAGAVIPLIPDNVQTLIRRHPRLSPDVVALDDSRVIQIWPGPAGTLVTSEGIRVEASSQEEHGLVSVASTDSRPLEIHFIHRRIENIKSPVIPFASAEFDVLKNTTVCRWDRFQGETVLTW